MVLLLPSLTDIEVSEPPAVALFREIDAPASTERISATADGFGISAVTPTWVQRAVFIGSRFVFLFALV